MAATPTLSPAQRLRVGWELARAPAPTALHMPVEGVDPRRIAATFGAPRGRDRQHAGVDIFARRGTPVVSATRGIVVAIADRGLGGRLLLQALLQGVVDAELPRQFVQVAALHEALFVGGEQAGQVHFRGHLGTGRRARHLGRIQRLFQFRMQPLLHVGIVAVEAGELAFDQAALVLVQMAIGLGRADQRAQHRLAVLLDFQRRQPVQRLRFGCGGAQLLAAVVAVGAIGHQPQRGQAAVGRQLAGGAVLAKQQAECAAAEGSLAEVGVEQTAQAAGAGVRRCGRSGGAGLGHGLAGGALRRLQQLVEKAL